MKPFGLKKTQSRSFADPLLEYLPPLFDVAAVSDSEYEDLESLAQLGDKEVVRERIQKLGLTLTPDQMAEKILFNDGQRVVVSGMRFRSLDLAFPFVALKTNFRVLDRETVSFLRALVVKDYEEVAPKGFTFYEAPGLHAGQASTWSLVVAGPTSTEAELLPDTLERRWESSSSDFYDTYSAEFVTWTSKHERLAKFVRAESKADLDQAAAKKLLLSVYDERGWAGAIAGESSPLFGNEALYIFELFLTERLRGQGLAKRLQAQFLAGAKERFQLVWGHIHQDNTPSLKAALAVGRVPVQQEYFVSLEV